MKRNALFLILGAVALLAAVPGVAQPRPSVARTSVIALQVNVGPPGSAQHVRYGVQPTNEPVPISPGQSVQVALVGSSIVNNVGVERPIRAHFHVVAGGGALELGQSGSNWVTVYCRGGNGNGLAQLGYDVTDNAYTMRSGFESGRITFQISGGGGVAPGPDDDRFRAAQRITRTLYRAILGQEDMGPRGEEDVASVDRGGYTAIQNVARRLANRAVSEGIYNGQNAPDIVGRLYRDLLRRTGSDREMAQSDPGFRDNVNLLRNRGLVEVVRVIVGSPEFQRVQELDRNGLLYEGRR